MGKLWKSFTLATAMYSSIPTPRTEWDGDSMAYAFCFFPWVGLVVGGAELLWWHVAAALGIEGLLFAAVAALLPLLITGGIHLDGFLDVADARGSHQSRERKLEILKDSHVGAFAVIAMGCYLLLYTALWSAVMPHPALALVPVLSRPSRASRPSTGRTPGAAGCWRPFPRPRPCGPTGWCWFCGCWLRPWYWAFSRDGRASPF